MHEENWVTVAYFAFLLAITALWAARQNRVISRRQLSEDCLKKGSGQQAWCSERENQRESFIRRKEHYIGANSETSLNKPSFLTTVRAREMAQCIKALAHRLGGWVQFLDPTRWPKRTDSQTVLQPPPELCGTQSTTLIHIYIWQIKNFKLNWGLERRLSS